MELVYVWIEKYSSVLEDIEVNFGGEFIFKYDENKKTLCINKNQYYIKNFFNTEGNNNISNITGIIGKNGSGKSNLINCIRGYMADGGIKCMEKNKKYEFHNTILAIKEDKRVHIFISDKLVNSKENIYYDKDLDVDIIFYGENHIEDAQKYKIIKVNDRSKLKIIDKSDKLKDISCIYMSNIFDLSVPEYNTESKINYFDISTNGILDELEKGLINISGGISNKEVFINEELGEISNKFKISSTRRYKMYRKLQELKFISDNIDNYNYIQSKKFKLPNEILIITDYSYEQYHNPKFFRFENLLRYEDKNKINKIEDDIYKRLDIQIEGCNDDKIKAKFIAYKSLIIRIIDSYFNDIYRIIHNTKEYKLKFSKNISKAYTKPFIDYEILYSLDKIKEIIINTANELSKSDETYKQFSENGKGINAIEEKHELYVNLIKFIEELLFKDSKISEYMEINVFYEMITIKKDGTASGKQEKMANIILQLNSYTLNKIRKFMEIMIDLESTEDFIMFEFRNISSGEYTLLDTYSKLYSLKDTIKTDNILLLIDEGELYLHPEWQREYINMLIEFLPKVFVKKNIQIVFASNSPFLISDLPRNNIIVLDKINDKIVVSNNSIVKQTFAANISKLLDDTFFMEYNIGEFSKTKIENTIKILKSDGYNDENTRDKVKKIIELIDDPIIKNKLKELYNKKYGDLENQIKNLEYHIAKLINQKEILENELNKGENDDKN